jgi:DNA-binding NarL/FixJ family response regulator
VIAARHLNRSRAEAVVCVCSPRGADQAELLRAIRAVASGEALFGPTVARRLTAFFATPWQGSSVPLPELTDREREILGLTPAVRAIAWPKE